ncbi:MAG: hypothetical protein FVQ82_14335 [Planctomycetes bacterium]|nr:hypothetical protein [Planctomycetota bacterium]
MNMKTAGVLFLAIVITVTVSGCVTLEDRRVRTKPSYPVELLPSQHAYVKAGGGYEKNGVLVIEGKVRRSVKACCSPITGHVDIMISGADMTIIDIVTAPISPGIIPTMASRQSSFKVKLSYMPPPGSSIRAKFHGRKFLSGSSEKKVDCLNNIMPVQLTPKSITRI